MCKKIKKSFISLLTVFLIIALVGGVFATSSPTNSNTSINIPKNVQISKDRAILIAKLNEGKNGFCDGIIVKNVSLTSDKKFWLVKLADSESTWYVTVNIINGNSKKNQGKWKSFNEMKAVYIADLYAGDANPKFGTSQIVNVSGKKIWKIPVYEDFGSKKIFRFYVYFDASNGVSKRDGTKWMTLKELDKVISHQYEINFRDALRELYP